MGGGVTSSRELLHPCGLIVLVYSHLFATEPRNEYHKTEIVIPRREINASTNKHNASTAISVL